MFVGYSDNGVGKRDPNHREGRKVEGPNDVEKLVLGEDIDQLIVNKHLQLHPTTAATRYELGKERVPNAFRRYTTRGQTAGRGHGTCTYQQTTRHRGGNRKNALVGREVRCNDNCISSNGGSI